MILPSRHQSKTSSLVNRKLAWMEFYQHCSLNLVQSLRKVRCNNCKPAFHNIAQELQVPGMFLCFLMCTNSKKSGIRSLAIINMPTVSSNLCALSLQHHRVSRRRTILHKVFPY